MNQSLLIIGPDIRFRGVGGVTIHVQRLRDYLEKNCVEYTFKDYKSNNLWTLMREIYHHKVIHIHISNPQYQFLMVFLCRMMGKQTIMTLHGDYGRFGWLRNHLVRLAISEVNVPIVINAKSFESCKYFNKNIRCISAFIPPQKEDALQYGIIELTERIHSAGKRIITTNASNVALDKNGMDVYGIDFLVQFFKNSSTMALIVSDPSGNYTKKYLGLTSDTVFFINYPHPYYELLKHVDVFVRNTSTDGDALSVKEALSLGVTTLCTDVVDRPAGVRLFKYCDRASFETAISSNDVAAVSIENGADSVLEVYKDLLLRQV